MCFVALVKICSTSFISLDLDNELKRLTKHLPWSQLTSCYVLAPIQNGLFFAGGGGGGGGGGESFGNGVEGGGFSENQPIKSRNVGAMMYEIGGLNA